jgi:RNA polymerase sigma-70 factor (ECF subfamily)
MGGGPKELARANVQDRVLTLVLDAAFTSTRPTGPEPQRTPPRAHGRWREGARGESVQAGPKSAMTAPSDRELFDRARGGDHGAFSQIVRRYQARIHRLAMHLVRNYAEAEDVAQETFIRAYRALGRFDGRSEPYTWLYRIAVNLSLNALRSRKSRRTTTEADDPRLDALINERPSETDVRGDAAQRQLYATLALGIDELSETLRTTLVLVCVDGRSHEEASAILGAPEGTIAWRVHEARRKLREYMAKRGFDPEET